MCCCIETISPPRLVKARKDYEDSAGLWIREALSEMRRGWFKPISFADWRVIAKAKAENWTIKKGEIHEHCVLKQDGDIYSFRCKPGLNKICLKYDLYPEC